jgi:hypothetical protein
VHKSTARKNMMDNLNSIFNSINDMKKEMEQGIQKYNTSQIWISVKQAVSILNISDRAVRKNCSTGKYTTMPIDGNGGKQYNILLSSLPIQAQTKYYSEKGIILNQPGGRQNLLRTKT